MTLTVDPTSAVPIYMQIVDRLRHLIASGEIAPGDQLPTVRSLAQDLRVNFNTVARAYAVLDEAGIISTQQGRGTFVRARPDPRVQAELRAERLRVLVGGAVVEALSLGYTPAEIRDACDMALRRVNESRPTEES